MRLPLKDKQAALKALSGLSINLAAAWYAAVFVIPNFSGLRNLSDIGGIDNGFVFGYIMFVGFI